MATTYRTLTSNDVVKSRTRLHEYIPITGSILSGSIYSDRNVKSFSHGLYESIYDYPHVSSSANHIMDISFGVFSGSGAPHTVSKNDKGRIYQLYSQMLMGFHHQSSKGSGRASQNYGIQFDQDGNIAGGGTKMNECYFVNFSRLLIKDEIKKGTFNLTLGIGKSYLDPFTGSAVIRDVAVAEKGQTVSYNAADSYRINAAIGEYGFLYMSGSDDNPSQGYSDGFTTQIKLINNSSTDKTAERTITIDTAAAANNDGGSGVGKVLVAFGDSEATTTITVTPDNAPGTSITTAQLVELINTGAVSGVTTQITGDSLRQSLKATGGGSEVLEHGQSNRDGDVINLAKVRGMIDISSPDSLKLPVGLIFYQPGILVLTSSIFNDNIFENARIPGTGLELTSSSGTKTEIYTATIPNLARGFRNRIRNITFNNTVELNSTIYMCRAQLGDYNYSSNPTYISQSKVVVKSERTDQPVAYATSIGLYSSDNELLAVAKTSEPLRKDPSSELTMRVRLDY